MQTIQEIQTEVTEFVGTIPQITVTTQEEYTKAGDVTKQLLMRIKQLNEKRLEYTRPLDESKNRIMADFKAMIEPLETMVNQIKSGMTTWYMAEQKRIDNERRAAQRAAEKAAAEERARIEAEQAKSRAENPSEPVFPTPIVQQAPVVATPDIKTQHGAVSTTTMRKRWTYEVIDEDAIPRKYLVLDRGAVQASIRAGIRNIAGIKIYEELDPSIR